MFPGTFDPVTLGHLDIIARALRLFDELIVAVAHRHHKATLFDVGERMEMIREGLPDAVASRVRVVPFEGLLVEFARAQRVAGIVRGLRFVSDFEYEFQMALMNQKLCPEITTFFLMPTEQFSYVNATLVKEVARSGGAVDGLVTPRTAERLRERYARMREAAAVVTGIGAQAEGEPSRRGRRGGAPRAKAGTRAGSRGARGTRRKAAGRGAANERRTGRER
jgi:pantetheine-phosphate adenylyltransferase